jgi:hypothetical protein
MRCHLMDRESLLWANKRSSDHLRATSALPSTADGVDGSRSRHLGAKVRCHSMGSECLLSANRRSSEGCLSRSALPPRTDVQNPMSPSALMMSAKLIRCQSRCHRAVPGKEPRREGHLLGALRLTSSYDAVFWCRWCISRYFSCLYVWVPVTCPYRSVRTVSLKYGNNPVGSGHYWGRGGW